MAVDPSIELRDVINHYRNPHLPRDVDDAVQASGRPETIRSGTIPRRHDRGRRHPSTGRPPLLADAGAAGRPAAPA